jgi:hypothetical protein
MGKSRGQQCGLLAWATSGIGQLSLAEHALCPLDTRVSLQQNLRHASEYRYTDADSRGQSARVVVHCPAGLSAGDEFYLWGLLALTFAQPEPQIEFQATPHFCLRRLGIISPDSKGGKSYRLFRDSLRRLSAVHYQNERFYDPIRREHRAVSFGLFSYSLPVNVDSSRAWRIVWNPLFFEYCRATAGQLRFDLDTYRQLDHASRRLFLLLSKVFWRRSISPRFNVRHLAVDVLGFSTNLATRTLKAKVKRCAEVLTCHKVIAMTMEPNQRLPQKQSKRDCAVQFTRGVYYDRRHSARQSAAIEESPLYDPLCAIGFNLEAVNRILQRFAIEQIQLWADVTLAAIERKGPSFFRRSPQAFFMDNIQNAASGNRTPPEWFWVLRSEEQRRRTARVRRMRGCQTPSPDRSLLHKTHTIERAFSFDQSPAEFVSNVSAHFLAAGQTESDATNNARQFADESLRTSRRAAK